MIPILMQNDTVVGFLADALSCIVTEERNGVFELSLTYTGDIKVASGTNAAEQYTRATYNGNMSGVVVHFYADGETVCGVDAQFVMNTDKNNAILLEVTGVEAANMGEVITITIDGFGTIEFCGNDFARLLAKNESTKTLGTALYLYGKAAMACFA